MKLAHGVKCERHNEDGLSVTHEQCLDRMADTDTPSPARMTMSEERRGEGKGPYDPDERRRLTARGVLMTVQMSKLE